MEPFVLDASVAFSWCFPDDPSENTPYSRATLGLLEQADAVVPEIWPFEIGNSIFISYSKRKRINDWGPRWKKAIVTLAPGQKIEIFEGI